MKELTSEQVTTVSGAGSDIDLKPLPDSDAPTTGDAPFIPGKPGYKENDVPGSNTGIHCLV